MTYDEYIKNPMGAKNAVFSGREMYAKMYTEKWNAIMLREAGFVGYTLYTTDRDYIVHFKIPSENIDRFYYDVVIRFFHKNEEGAKKFSGSLTDYSVQFFSNDPSFVYTFTYAFKKNNLFFLDMENRMSKLALTRVGKEKNPTSQVGYVKTLYFAYLEMKHLGLFNKVNWSHSRAYTGKKMWIHLVEHADDKIKERQSVASALSKKHKRTRHAQINNSIQKFAKGFKSPNIKNFGHLNPVNFLSKFKSPNIKDFGKLKKPLFNKSFKPNNGK